MTKQTIDRPVHYYDTQQHHIACGSPGAEDHSTKHPRGVTCGECIALLHEAAGRAHDSSGAASTGI
jgi:hypothetical protein